LTDNQKIPLQAYGEVIWFNGSVSSLTLVSFGLMVLSSLIAAWSDISPFLSNSPAHDSAITEPLIYGQIVKKNVGYFWMLVNCFASAAYVSHLSPQPHFKKKKKKTLIVVVMARHSDTKAFFFFCKKVLAMRKKIKLTNFKDWDTMFYNNLLSIPILIVFSLAFEDWSQNSLTLNL
jgi:GDP-mannose transporter